MCSSDLLAARTARIGVATADLYPSLSLTGSFGYESIDASDFFDAGSRAFTLGPALGAVTGVMVGMYYRQISFTMGWSFGLKAFTATIMGGIGNIPGAMFGGLILGILEMLGAAYISSAWKDVFVFLILILVLIFRPTGIFGERVAEKV